MCTGIWHRVPTMEPYYSVAMVERREEKTEPLSKFTPKPSHNISQGDPNITHRPPHGDLCGPTVHNQFRCYFRRDWLLLDFV